MSTSNKQQQIWVPVGKLNGLFGVKGWVKVFSNTQPKENILTYSPWFLKRNGQWQEFKLLSGKSHGKGVIAQLDGCIDRDTAAELIGSDIAIKHEQLAKPASGEYYWNNLIGLLVTNLEGIELGKITSMLETGANDVMIVHSGEKDTKGKKRERLIPFISEEVVHEINLEQGFMTVDWDAEF
jgi:16S rRNA processing protein RimM